MILDDRLKEQIEEHAIVAYNLDLGTSFYCRDTCGESIFFDYVFQQLAVDHLCLLFDLSKKEATQLIIKNLHPKEKKLPRNWLVNFQPELSI